MNKLIGKDKTTGKLYIKDNSLSGMIKAIEKLYELEEGIEAAELGNPNFDSYNYKQGWQDCLIMIDSYVSEE